MRRLAASTSAINASVAPIVISLGQFFWFWQAHIYRFAAEDKSNLATLPVSGFNVGVAASNS